jgi:hypothetical protein
MARRDFRTLLNKTWGYAEKYCQKYNQYDARCDFFKLFSMLNLWLLLELDNFSELVDPTNAKISRYMTLARTDRIQYLLQHDTINRSSYCTKAMFDTEYFLASIADRLGLDSNKTKYYKLTEQLLLRLKIKGMERDNIKDHKYYKVLNAPAQVRNSLHNNGYAGFNFEITLRGRTYNFIKDQQVKFTGWDNLYIFFDELLDVLIEIINNPAVQKINNVPHTSTFYRGVE